MGQCTQRFGLPAGSLRDGFLSYLTQSTDQTDASLEATENRGKQHVRGAISQNRHQEEPKIRNGLRGPRTFNQAG